MKNFVTRKMIKLTETIRQFLPTSCLSVFDHFVGLALKKLILAWNFHVESLS